MALHLSFSFRYFLSAGGSIARMLLYRARYASNGSGANSPECLTCNMESCPSSRVNFAPSGKQFVLFCHLAYHSTKTYLKKVDEISSGYFFDQPIGRGIHLRLQNIFTLVKFAELFTSFSRRLCGFALYPTFTSKFSPPLSLLFLGEQSSCCTPSLLQFFASERWKEFKICCRFEKCGWEVSSVGQLHSTDENMKVILPH